MEEEKPALPQNTIDGPKVPGSDLPEQAPRPKEIGGPKGPEPTRYGDWEIGGRCTDF